MTTEPLMEITGTLAEPPRPQMQPIGEVGDARPVLKLVLHDCGVSNRRLTATQVFPVGAVAACHHRAAQLKVGMRLRVQAPASQIEWHMTAVQHVHIVPTEPQEQANG